MECDDQEKTCGLYPPALALLVSSALVGCALHPQTPACNAPPASGIPTSGHAACAEPERAEAEDFPDGAGVAVALSSITSFVVPITDERMQAGIQGGECGVGAPSHAEAAGKGQAVPTASAGPPDEPLGTVPPFQPRMTEPGSVPASDAPLLALKAYMELSGNCPQELVEWNKEKLGKVLAGAIPRGLYYRVLGYLDWGHCGRPFFPAIFEELQKIADIHAQGLATRAELESKERELINLFFAAVKDPENGEKLVRDYEMATAARLKRLAPPKAYLSCTFVADRAECLAQQAAETTTRRRRGPIIPHSRRPVAAIGQGAEASAPLWRAVSDAPLQALNAYIELSGTCSRELLEWNQKYGRKTMAGETSRVFYYRVLGYMGWGQCGQGFFRPIFSELLKSSEIYAQGRASAAEFEAKEAELVGLFFAALNDQKQGAEKVDAYETATAARLTELAEPRQYFDCTFFGGKPLCRE